MRKIILYILGALLLVGAYFGAQSIIENSKQPKPVAKEVIKTVFVKPAKNTTVPIEISANGTLTAKNRLELFAEVQGVFRSSSHDFKPGQFYRRGEVLLRLDADEFYASVQSARSEFYNLVTALMPDLRLDYPDAYPAWQAYLDELSIDKALPELPDLDNDKLRYFITGRGITTAYYNIKNQEQRLGKYVVRAPYDGIVTEALVTRGTLVRTGQKLGEFIDTSAYELQLAVGKEFSDLLKLGASVSLTNLNKTKSYQGKVNRINGKIDQATQTIAVFVEVVSEDLKEGMYLEAVANARQQENAMRISRKLLVNETEVYIVRDSLLDLMPVEPVHFSDKHVVIKGLPDGVMMLSKPIPGAYPGMKVKYISDSEVDAAATSSISK